MRKRANLTRNRKAISLGVVIPAYNEEANIATLLEEWSNQLKVMKIDYRIFVVNDGSKDRTSQLVNEYAKKDKRVSLLNKTNSGHGSTLIYGYQHAIQLNCEWIFQIDGDRQTLPEEFAEFWKNREYTDFAFGRRLGRQDGRSRVFVTRGLQLFLLLFFRQWVPDANTPYRLMRSAALFQIISHLPADFFLSNVAISVFALKTRKRVIWYDISFLPRQGGINSINLRRIAKIAFKAIRDFWNIRSNYKYIE